MLMFIATKKVIRNDKVLIVRVKSLYHGTRYALYVNDKPVDRGSYDYIEERFVSY